MLYLTQLSIYFVLFFHYLQHQIVVAITLSIQIVVAVLFYIFAFRIMTISLCEYSTSVPTLLDTLLCSSTFDITNLTSLLCNNLIQHHATSLHSYNCTFLYSFCMFAQTLIVLTFAFIIINLLYPLFVNKAFQYI